MVREGKWNVNILLHTFQVGRRVTHRFSISGRYLEIKKALLQTNWDFDVWTTKFGGYGKDTRQKDTYTFISSTHHFKLELGHTLYTYNTLYTVTMSMSEEIRVSIRMSLHHQESPWTLVR